MLLCACLLAGRAAGATAGAPAPSPLASPTGCPSLATPLDPQAGSWVLTLYVPPDLVPLFALPGEPQAVDAAGGRTLDDLLEAYSQSEGGSAIEVNM